MTPETAVEITRDIEPPQPVRAGAGVGMSVIIASRNRAASLRETLEEMGRQHTRGEFTYEVVVADNGSTDGTRAMVESLQAAYPVPLRYVHEPQRGKSHALNAGMRAAAGRYFAFTDDDVMPTPEWLYGLWRCFVEERADAIGARIVPLWTDGRPEWVTDEFVKNGRMGCIDFGETRLPASRHRFSRWVGGNVAIRREVFERVGGYDTRMIRAQDTEYFRRCVGQGCKVVYEPNALCYHKIGRDRLTPEYFRRWSRMTGYYHTYLLGWRKYHVFTIVSTDWYTHTFSLIATWLWYAATRRPWIERFQVELILRERLSHYAHRVQIWPRWWLTVLTGRSFLP